MKLRENIYQLEVYRPKYLQYKLKAGKTDYEKDYLMQFEKIMSRAEQGVTEGMEETRSLFQDAKAHLLDFFKASAENPYLVRFLLEHQSLLEKVYGKKEQERFFSSFLKTVFWTPTGSQARVIWIASTTISHPSIFKGPETQSRHPELRSLLNFSQGMDAYYRNDYPKATLLLSKTDPSQTDGKLKREFLRKAEEACHKIARK